MQWHRKAPCRSWCTFSLPCTKTPRNLCHLWWMRKYHWIGGQTCCRHHCLNFPLRWRHYTPKSYYAWEGRTRMHPRCWLRGASPTSFMWFPWPTKRCPKLCKKLLDPRSRRTVIDFEKCSPLQCQTNHPQVTPIVHNTSSALSPPRLHRNDCKGNCVGLLTGIQKRYFELPD